MRLRKLSAILFSAAVSLCAVASDIDISFNLNNDEALLYGFKKKETYDVALRILDPAFAGAKVKGFKVELPVKDGAIKDVSGWLSSELKLVGSKNAPDLAVQPAEIVNYILDVRFDTPCEISAQGIWVGYSFTITNLGEEYGYPEIPVAVIGSKENLSDGLWMHTSRTRLKWENVGEIISAVSPMIITLETNFGDHDVAVGVPADVYVERGKDFTVPVNVINHGSVPVSDIDYSYTLAGKESSGSLHLDNPVEIMGASQTVDFPFGAIDELGEYPLTFTINSTNGEPNNDGLRTGAGTVNVWPVIPVTRPLVEEFTGLGCGYCPRGYVAMEYMKEVFGDRFVGMAFHSSSYENAMVTVRNSDFPVSVSSFPNADFNRRNLMDPSYMPFEWEKYASEPSPAEISVEAEWADENHSEAVLTSKLTFVKDIDKANYKLAFAMTGDNLHNDTWRQANYYSGDESGDGVESPLWDIFLDGPRYVGDLVFNDVVVYFKDIPGIEGSVPSEIKAGETLEYTYRIPMEDVVTIQGNRFLNSDAKLRGVVILLDGETGYSVNCNKSDYLPNATTGIEDVAESGATVVRTEYHNLQGMRVSRPGTGAYIRTDIMSDGSRRTLKGCNH